MSAKWIHILHLTERWLHWATLSAHGRMLSLHETGSLTPVDDEPSSKLLDRWVQRPEFHDGRIDLYDGRPMAFSFTGRHPTAVRRQLDQVVGLKIREQLGLDREMVHWATRTDAAGDDHVDVFTVVVRKGVLDDVVSWRREHDLQSVWVGVDIMAIHSLIRQDAVPTPLVVVNADSVGATLFHVDAQGRILKRSLENGHTTDASQASDSGLDASAPRLHFHHGDQRFDAAAHPELAGRTPLPEIDWAADKQSQDRWGRVVAELVSFDPVISGGVIELRRPHVADLLRDETSSPPALQWVEGFSAKKLAHWAGTATLIFLILVLGVFAQRRSARAKCLERARAVASAIDIYRSQEQVLQQVRRERAPLLPVFEALHEAAPSGVMLETLSISPTGRLQLRGKAPNEGNINELSRALAGGGLFETALPQNIKHDPKKKNYSFTVVAQMKGRGRGKR